MRTDRRLLEVVKRIELNPSSRYESSLAIKEVPPDYDYRIDDYDGRETVMIFPDHKGVIDDLVRYYRTGSRDFQCPITQQVIDEDITFLKKLLKIYFV